MDGRLLIPLLPLVALAAGCLPAGRGPLPPATGGGTVLARIEGEASYYADTFEGRPTASGEIFTQNGLTAAHRSWPFGTIVRVHNPANGRMVTVTINDRGPSPPGRILDLSRRAATELDMIGAGVARIRAEILRWGEPPP